MKLLWIIAFAIIIGLTVGGNLPIMSGPPPSASTAYAQAEPKGPMDGIKIEIQNELRDIKLCEEEGSTFDECYNKIVPIYAEKVEKIEREAKAQAEPEKSESCLKNGFGCPPTQAEPRGGNSEEYEEEEPEEQVTQYTSLPKCGDPQVEEILTNLMKEAGKAVYKDNMAILTYVAQTTFLAKAQNKPSPWAGIGPLNTEGPSNETANGLPRELFTDPKAMDAYRNKLHAVIDGMNVTFKGSREVREGEDAGTKFCAANFSFSGKDLWGDEIEPVTNVVTYFVQLTEDGELYVEGTGGADFGRKDPDPVAQQLEALRQQQEQQYDDQVQRRTYENFWNRNRN